MSLPPVRDLVNVFELEAAAQTVLPPAVFAELASQPAERRAFDRITFRPRLMRNVSALDLAVELFGEKHFTPILVGPIARPERFHASGLAALRAGCEAGQAALIQPLEPGAPAIPAGARLVVVRGAELERVRRLTKLPVVVKGILSVADARLAAERGANGIIVSSYGTDEALSPLDALPPIAEAVGSRLTILADGGFRRGTDIAKALALGARAVLIARPAVWGLAAYGAEGVQVAVELLQSELARAVAMLGRVTVAELDRTALRFHRW